MPDTSWTPPNLEYPPPKADEPPLFRSVREGDHAAIRSLIDSGADPNQVFDIGLDPGAHDYPATPLMIAAGSGDGASVETVRLLLSMCADARLTTSAGSAADFACRGLGWNYRPGGDAERMAVLLSAGSPITLAGRVGNRLVSDTARSGDAARLGVLLRSGASANPWFDPVSAKAEHEYFRARMKAFTASTPDPFADLPVDIRASIEAQRLEEEKNDAARAATAPNADEIPLFQAAASGSLECVQMLLDAGADVRQRDDALRTALWEASTPEIARLLVQRGLRTVDTDWLEWTPLRSNLGELNRTAALIAAGADVNATYNSGYTVFMSAVGSGRNIEVLRLLVASGADPLAVSELGYNAFHAAIDVNGEANAEESVRTVFAYLKELGVNMEHRNQSGMTPLGRAINNGNGTEVRVLCELGANPNAPSRFHRCGDDGCELPEELPLFAASRGSVGSDEKTAALLRAGAEPLAKDSEGHTALARAVAKLCSGADDYATAFREFYTRVRAVRVMGDSTPSNRDSFVNEVKAHIRPVIVTFADTIPIPQYCQFDAQWRQELVNTVVSLCAYEVWARASQRVPGNT